MEGIGILYITSKKNFKNLKRAAVKNLGFKNKKYIFAVKVNYFKIGGLIFLSKISFLQKGCEHP